MGGQFRCSRTRRLDDANTCHSCILSLAKKGPTILERSRIFVLTNTVFSGARKATNRATGLPALAMMTSFPLLRRFDECGKLGLRFGNVAHDHTRILVLNQ